MDRLLAVLGSLLAALAIGYGVVHADVRGASTSPTAPPTSTAPRAPVGVPAGGPASAPATPSASDLVEWPTLTAYEYAPAMANLPDAVKALDGKTVRMRGFLLPLYEFDDIHRFILVANHMSCCFGIPAGMTGQVYVEMKGAERGLPNTNEPIEVVGSFHARERTEQGYVLSVYELIDATARIVGY